MTYTIQRIRTLTPAHIHEINRLQALTLPSDDPFPIVEGHWWLAYHDDIAVGFAGLVESRRWQGCGYLCRAGVDPDHRGHRLQGRLIRARVAYAKRLGWEWCFCNTYGNAASANSLIRAGFKIYDPQLEYCAPGTLYWRLKLT